MGQGSRIERLRDLLLEVINELVRELKDPRLEGKFMTFTDVKIAKDLGVARFFVSVFGEEKDAEVALEALNNASGYLRKQLGRQLKLKKIPKPFFSLDDTYRKNENLLTLLSDISEELSEEE